MGSLGLGSRGEGSGIWDVKLMDNDKVVRVFEVWGLGDQAETLNRNPKP